MSKKNTISISRKLIQFLALCLFLFLTIAGKNQAWMLIMLGSLVLTTIFGRFYCGWLCPIHTVIRPASWFAQKINLQKPKIPQVLKSPWLRFSIFTAFLLTLIMTIQGKIQLDILLILIGLAFLLTLFYPAFLWHRYLCPFGVLFGIPGRISLFKFGISQDKCLKCGKCSNICPGDSIQLKNLNYKINPTHCLFCFECSNQCPQKAIKTQFNINKFPQNKSTGRNLD